MKGHYLFRLAWTAFIVAVTTLPYLVNAFSTPARHQYTWIIPPYPEDCEWGS